MDILVVGFPKSGNTWLSRLLGEVLGCPVTGWKNARPLATEGLDRESVYTVRQLHLWPRYGPCQDGLLPDARTFCIRSWDPSHTKVVHVQRDPRDVAVSCMYYWDIADIETTIHAMGQRNWPLHHGPWRDYVQAWARVRGVPTVHYEDLQQDAAGVLYRLLRRWGLSQPMDKIRRAVEVQGFDATRGRLEIDGRNRPHGKAVQLKNLRKGVSGDWANHFNEWHQKLAQGYFAMMPAEVERVLVELFMEPFADKLQNPRMGKCQALYGLVTALGPGAQAVELGVYHGCGAITMALAGAEVTGVDCYEEYTGWAGDRYEPEDEQTFREHELLAGVQVALERGTAQDVAAQWQREVDLVHWDLARQTLEVDFGAWSPFLKKGGVFAIHDTWPKPRFGAQELVDRMSRRQEWRAGQVFPVAGIWTLVKVA